MKMIVVTDPHHEFFGRMCRIVNSSDSTVFVRPIYSTDVLSIESDQYETSKED